MTIVQQVLAVAASGGLGSVLTYVLTLPQRRAILAAQAAKTESEGTALVVKASAELLVEAGKSLPALRETLARVVAELEGERKRGDRLEADLAADRADTADLLRWVDDARHWMQRAHRELTDRGVTIEPPPDPPARATSTRTRRAAGSSTTGEDTSP